MIKPAVFKALQAKLGKKDGFASKAASAVMAAKSRKKGKRS